MYFENRYSELKQQVIKALNCQQMLLLHARKIGQTCLEYRCNIVNSLLRISEH